MRFLCCILIIAVCISPASAGAADSDTNTGQDVTDPVQRVDFRLGYLDLPNGVAASTFILRYDKPINLGDGWKLGLRFDAPFAYNDVPSLDNPTGSWEFGYGDTLT